MEDTANFLLAASSLRAGRPSKHTVPEQLSYSSLGTCRNPELRGQNGELTGLYGVFQSEDGGETASLLSQYFAPTLMQDSDFEEDLEKALSQTAQNLVASVAFRKASMCLLVTRDGLCFSLSVGGSAKAVLVRAPGSGSPSGDPIVISRNESDSASSDKSSNPFHVTVTGLDYEDLYLFLGSDGLWTAMDIETVTRVVTESVRWNPHKIQKAVNKATQIAFRGGSQHVSAILVAINIDSLERSLGNLLATSSSSLKMRFSQGSRLAARVFSGLKPLGRRSKSSPVGLDVDLCSTSELEATVDQDDFDDDIALSSDEFDGEMDVQEIITQRSVLLYAGRHGCLSATE